MTNLSKQGVFIDDGRSKREKENFQGVHFQGIDMKNRDVPISFVRSDFRGAKFEKMTFSKNNFSNSDFIDSVVTSSSFYNCQFKYAELYNSYFEMTSFSEVLFSSASMIKIIYQSCNFQKAIFEVNTFRECKFSDCQLTENKFSKNSMDEVEFENTRFRNIDLSNMTAINLYFNNCEFDNVIIDADYLGSYFFKGNFLANLQLKYRGKVFNLDMKQSDFLNNLFAIFFERERFYEAINIVIQKNLLDKKCASIYSLLEVVTNRLLAEKSQLKRTYQFDKIFKLLEYYINTGYVSVSDYFRIVAYYESLNIEHFEFFEQINFHEKTNRLKTIMDKIPMSYEFISSSLPNEKILLEVRIDEHDEKEFEILFRKVISNLEKCLPTSETSSYEIIAKRKGSLIYDILIYAGVGLLLLKMIKLILRTNRQILHESINLAIDYKVDKKILVAARKIKGKTEIEQAKRIREYQVLSKQVINENEVKDVSEIKELVPLLKSIVVYPNALGDGKS